MPFKSKKQRKYLWANKPKMAREWTNKYGSGISDNTDPTAKKALKDAEKSKAKKDKKWQV